MSITATPTSTVTLAREYLRVSYDKSGRERSNDEQHGDNERDAAEHGWKLGKPYRDTGSASRHASKRRADFDRLVADLEADQFGAQVLILWESSRGSRRLSEWAVFLELLEERSVQVWVTTHRRLYDLSNPRDRRTLHEDGVDSEYESGKISTRSKRASAANAADGRPHGRIPYGYRRTYDPTNGRLVGQEPEPAEAAVVVELFERLEAGHSLKAIARDFHARGIASRNGVPFKPETLRPMALTPLYAGYRSHAPGRDMTRQERLRRSTLVKATWPALVDDATFKAVQARLNDPSRVTTRPGRGKHLLSMIAVCDVCGGVVAATYRDGSRQYQCHTGGHLRIDADDLDALAEAAILTYLTDPANVGQLADADVGEALAAARDEVASISAEHAELTRQVGDGSLSATLAAGAEPRILARLRAAERRVEELSTPSALRGLIGPADDVQERWDAAPMSTRREVARLLLVPDLVGQLRVARSPKRGHRVPVTERVVWR
jgi:DNA invertase Pin-like site-specific DNA recombinase